MRGCSKIFVYQASTHTAEQRHWLTAKYAFFKEHQNRKTLNQFFPALYEEYFALWPLIATPEGLEAAQGDVAVAVANVQKVEQTVRDFKLAE